LKIDREKASYLEGLASIVQYCIVYC